MNILEEIAEYARFRVMEDQKNISLEEMKRLAIEKAEAEKFDAEKADAEKTDAEKADAEKADAETSAGVPGQYSASSLFRFGQALKKPGLSVISEVKKASPSKGLIAPDFPYVDIAKDYEAAGADCVSCLTEPKWFLGSDQIFTEIREAIQLPMIRKDFVIDEYQIYQAKVMGADCVLLICALLDTETIKNYLAICERLHLDALVETHDEAEIRSAVASGAKIIGVNNRNLKDFSVDFENARRLRDLIPKEAVYVAESGVKTAADVELLKEIGADAVLVGEALMRSEHKKEMIREFKGEQKILEIGTTDVSETGTADVSEIGTTDVSETGTAGKKSSRPTVKICGIRRIEDCEYLNQYRPDYAGFVFWPKSFRCIEKTLAESFRTLLDPSIRTVGVFVDETVETILEIVKGGSISIVQLHGQEDDTYIKNLREALPSGISIWKAFKVRSVEDIEKAERSSADAVLLDNGYGTGECFDHRFLSSMKRPYTLAGGLNSENLKDVLETYAPAGIDLSSGVETDRVKDPEKIEKVISLVSDFRSFWTSDNEKA